MESRELRGNWLVFHPDRRVVSEEGVKKLILAGRKLFHQGRRLQHVHDIIKAGIVPTLCSLNHPRQGVDEAVQRPWSCTSIVQDLSTQKQVWQPSYISRSSFRQRRHTRISSRKDSHLAAFPFQVGMSLRSPEPASPAMWLLQRGANSDAAVAQATISAQSFSQL